MTSDSIQYIPHHLVDKTKWDQCIKTATNGLVYAQSFFLDRVSPSWDALIMDDYKIVMPLTWKKKFGFYYLYQPFFTPALGIFGNEGAVAVVHRFLASIPSKFRFWDFDLNEGNAMNAQESAPDWGIRQRANYFLDLNQPAERIEENFKRLARRMLHKASGQHLHIISGHDPAEVIDFCKTNYRKTHRVPGIAYDNLRRAVAANQEKSNVHTYLAKVDDGTTVGAYMVLSDNRFIYSVIGGTNETGKRTGAFYLLTANAIMQFANSKRTFRFEGSDLPGIAFFNAQFNAIPAHYYHLQCNRLPWPVRLIKK